eukprot:TRINITY_DN2207_c0_g1_i1.p1 TRINITY_DN2207_c0_g1~~TRINITY_DN2207_c0_g1_i1.p1  ORF type:complete len:332 (-),score=19.55 TRINITY_DN2207_c0_g1_i1:727-1695(-)
METSDNIHQIVITDLSSTDEEICSICFEWNNLHELSCSHLFCKDCLASYIRVCVHDNVYPIVCPQKDCGRELDPHDLSFLSSLGEEGLLRDWEAFSTLKLDSNARRCPACDEICVGEDDDKLLECLFCGVQFCKVHALAHSIDTSCEAYEVELLNDTDYNDSVAFIQQQYKSCPHCGVYIELKVGCDHVKCHNCNQKFCYRCGEASFTGEYFPRCNRCGRRYMDHDYFWIWNIIIVLTSPIWIPLSIVYTAVITLCLPLMCYRFDDFSHSKNCHDRFGYISIILFYPWLLSIVCCCGGPLTSEETMRLTQRVEGITYIEQTR